MSIMGKIFGEKEPVAKPVEKNESEVENRKQDLRNLYSQLDKANTGNDETEKARINEQIAKTREDLIELGLNESEVEDFLSQELGIAA